MKIFNVKDLSSEGVSVESLLELTPVETGNASFGMGAFGPDVRHPQTGLAHHDQHEISYIIEGRMILHMEDGDVNIEPGMVLWLEKGEPHATTALENGKVFYVLYG